VKVGDLVQIQRRGIGGEYRTGLRLGIESLEHLLLDQHVFEHGFDDQVGPRDIVVGQGALMRPSRLSNSSGVSRPFFSVLS
jgi:hypothetical protein